MSTAGEQMELLERRAFVPAAGSPQRWVYDVMEGGGWWMLHEIRDRIVHDGGPFYAETTISAKLRDLRKAEYGGFVIDIRPRPGANGFQYRMAQ